MAGGTDGQPATEHNGRDGGGEGRTRVSQEALDYVQNSPAVKALPGAEKLVLRQIAMLHRLEVNCAYVGVPQLTLLSLIGGKDPERQCRRILRRLEQRGLLLRHASTRSNGSQMSNEYEIPGMRMGTAVTEQMRQQVFRVPRTRVAAQLALSLGDGAIPDSSADTNRSTSLAVADSAVGSVGLAVEKTPEVSSPPLTPRVSSPPLTPRVSALDVKFDVIFDRDLPLPPLAAVECGKTGNGNRNGNSADQGQKQEATARATATATTSAIAEALPQRECVGSPAQRPPRRVLPFRRLRDAAAERERLDGFEAALFDVAMSILCHCGIAPKNATRRQWLAVSEALRDEVQRTGASLQDVEQDACKMWDDYTHAGDEGMLWRVVGAREFFAEGYWRKASGRSWDWDKAALSDRRRRLRL